MKPIEHLTEATFNATVDRRGLTVIDFWADWCGPCRAMAPQFERAASMRPQYSFAKVDVNTEPGLAARYGIRSIPTMMVLRNGEPIAAQAGLVGADQLVAALDRLAAPVAEATPAREAL